VSKIHALMIPNRPKILPSMVSLGVTASRSHIFASIHRERKKEKSDVVLHGSCDVLAGHLFPLQLPFPQIDIYKFCAAGIVDNVMEGFNGTVFAYGQVMSVVVPFG
jgi:hypothetical protein